MMILSAKVVKNPEVTKYCAECGWPIHNQMLKLYGMARPEEKPYNLFLHINCVIKEIMGTSDPKIQAALSRAKG